MVLKKILGVLTVMILMVSCKNESQPEVKTIEVETASKTVKKELNPNATYAKAEFTIDGMTCAIGCARTIEKKLAHMDGVKSATVDFGRRLAMVEYDEAMVNHISLEETVIKVADVYKVSDIKTVDEFSDKLDDAKVMSNNKECTVKCKSDCTEKDCTKCAEKSAECKKKCDTLRAEGKTDCKKECCANTKGKA